MTSTPVDPKSDAPAGTRNGAAPLFAALGVGYALVMSAVGIWWTPTGRQGVREFLVVVGIVAVTAAVVFGFVVRGAHGAAARTRTAVLGVLALAALVVFWSGAPFVLAAGAAATATAARRDHAPAGALTVVGLVAATAAVIGSTVASFAG